MDMSGNTATIIELHKSFSEQLANMSFTHGNYSVKEDEGVLTVYLRRSGECNSHVVVHIATYHSKGTATGKQHVHNIIIAIPYQRHVYW